MSYNRNNSYHLTTDNTITTWQDIIGDAKKNKTMAQILRDILKKVDKEDGKCLIPIEELARLRTLYNYDDTKIQGQIKNIQEFLDNLDLQGLREQIYSLEMTLFDIEQELEAQKRQMEELQRQVANAAKKEDIPTKVSQLDNDAEYLTRADVDIPSKLSELDNDCGFVTEQDMPKKVSELQNDSGFINKAECEQVVSVKVEDLNLFTYDEEE